MYVCLALYVINNTVHLCVSHNYVYFVIPSSKCHHDNLSLYPWESKLQTINGALTMYNPSVLR